MCTECNYSHYLEFHAYVVCLFLFSLTSFGFSSIVRGFYPALRICPHIQYNIFVKNERTYVRTCWSNM
uniref:Uncharacterized protein n=1 Tax=Panstrongylus lignarius TaxID=156445 RepID=A0A224Y737_9HEMI